MTAREQLDLTLLTMADRGERPPCADHGHPSPWLSEDRDERSHAAHLCGPCPALRPCQAAALEADETFGIWGGIDQTPNRTASRRSP